MANIEKRSENTYRIIVSNGYDINGKKIRKSTTVKLDKNLTEKQKIKELQKLAVLFENKVKDFDENLDDVLMYLSGEDITDVYSKTKEESSGSFNFSLNLITLLRK